MATRRAFLAGVAAAAAPGLTWAEAGAPAFLAAARRPDGGYELHGLKASGVSAFAIPLPARGHAAAAHPRQPVAVAFARRPGTFGIVLDCVSGAVIGRLTAPQGRAFAGHGAFSADGALLITTENAYEEGEGRLGVWDVRDGYRRIGEVATQGVGPHEIIRLSSGGYAVANGGILTHPSSGREKLNLDTMRPNLAFFDAGLEAQAIHELDADLHHNSIRHLAERADGAVAFATQWEGDAFDAPSLIGLCDATTGAQLLPGPDHLPTRMKGYAGSIACSPDGGALALTGPRGGVMPVFADGGVEMVVSDDICGVAPAPGGFIATTGTGLVLTVLEGRAQVLHRHPLAWDNHLIAL